MSAKMGGAGHNTWVCLHWWQRLGRRNQAIIRSRGVAANQGSRIHCMNVDAAGTKVSGRSRQGGRRSGVVVKRGSIVVQNQLLGRVATSMNKFCVWSLLTRSMMLLIV